MSRKKSLLKKIFIIDALSLQQGVCWELIETISLLLGLGCDLEAETGVLSSIKDNLKIEKDIKNEDDLKNGDEHKNEDNLENKDLKN